MRGGGKGGTVSPSEIISGVSFEPRIVLPPSHRLKKRQDFTAVFQQGIRRQTQHLRLRAYQKPVCPPGNQPTRIGFAVSQKVSKRAVIRNRIKRQLRHGLRQLLPQLRPDWDIVIIASPTAIECDYPQFLQELKQLLADAEIFDGH